MKTIEVPKAVVLIVVCTAAVIVLTGMFSLVTVMLFKIPVAEAILLVVVQASANAGGLLGGMLIKTKPEESEPKP
jgi:hypothetical protein